MKVLRIPQDEDELERYWDRVTHPCETVEDHRACPFIHPKGRCDCDDRCWPCRSARHISKCGAGCSTNHDDPYVNYATRPVDDGCGIEECCPYSPSFPDNKQNPYYEDDRKYERRLMSYGSPLCAKDGRLCGAPECPYCCHWSEVAEEWAARSIVDQLADLGRELASIVDRVAILDVKEVA